MWFLVPYLKQSASHERRVQALLSLLEPLSNPSTSLNSMLWSESTPPPLTQTWGCNQFPPSPSKPDNQMVYLKHKSDSHVTFMAKTPQWFPTMLHIKPIYLPLTARPFTIQFLLTFKIHTLLNCHSILSFAPGILDFWSLSLDPSGNVPSPLLKTTLPKVYYCPPFFRTLNDFPRKALCGLSQVNCCS